MKLIKLISFALILVLLLSACGKGSAGGVKKVYQPDWWRVQDSPDYVQSYGMDTKVNQNASYNAAYANAMQGASNYVESYVQSMIKNYVEEAGVENPQVLALTSSTAKVISKAKFNGVMVTKQETVITEEGRYKTFVRVSVPKEAVNKNMLNQIKNEEALYNQFKASQSFGELEKEMGNYNE